MANNNKEEPKKPATPASPPSKPSSASNTNSGNPAAGSKPATKPLATPPAPSAAAAKTPTTPTTKTTLPKTSTSPQPPLKKEPEPPAFEKGLVDEIQKQFSDSIKVVYIKPLRIKIFVDPKDITEVAIFVRDRMGFDHAESVAGTDYPKDGQIEVVYHLGSYSREDLGAHILLLATRTNRDDAHLPTLINVFKSVEYHERETFEMLGVFFEGHPRNDRFLLPEDWADIPPLRKDFRIKGR